LRTRGLWYNGDIVSQCAFLIVLDSIQEPVDGFGSRFSQSAL
jgi:hypothetical protein